MLQLNGSVVCVRACAFCCVVLAIASLLIVIFVLLLTVGRSVFIGELLLQTRYMTRPDQTIPNHAITYHTMPDTWYSTSSHCVLMSRKWKSNWPTFQFESRQFHHICHHTYISSSLINRKWYINFWYWLCTQLPEHVYKCRYQPGSWKTLSMQSIAIAYEAA